MRNVDIARQLSAIRALIKKSSAATAADLEIQAHWARYACVLTAGMLENAVEYLFSNFVKRNAQKPVADFANAQIAKVQNPKTNRFIEITRSFKRSWADDLENFTEQGGRKEAIDAIMTNRHLIVHGKDSNITIARVSDYLDRAEEVLRFIENQLK